MKKTILLLLITISTFGQVGINNANPQAILDIQSTSSGILIPRLTTVQKNAVENPAISMLIFDSNLNEYNYFDGIEWVGFKVKNNYSLQEVKTNGVWHNGKPIYRKVIVLPSGALSLIYNNQVVNIPNLDRLLPTSSYLFYRNFGNNEVRINPFYTSAAGSTPATFTNTDYIDLYQLGTDVKLKVVGSSTSVGSYESTYILEYTKTTD